MKANAGRPFGKRAPPSEALPDNTGSFSSDADYAQASAAGREKTTRRPAGKADALRRRFQGEHHGHDTKRFFENDDNGFCRTGIRSR